MLKVKNLTVSFQFDDGKKYKAIEDVAFSLKAGQTLGLVGESGCGKSVTALSILRLLPRPTATIESGDIIFDEQNLATLAPELLRKIRGRRISMIFQEPMTALNPVLKIYKQIAEIYAIHFPELSNAEVKTEIEEIFKRVGISDIENKLNSYPHELSGGLRQRVMIAMALACRPEILIADEPTTALDVTIQAQILDLLRELQRDLGMAILFITHDLGVVSEMCQDVAVMYAGEIVEYGTSESIFKQPQHPYTNGLLRSIPTLDTPPRVALAVIKGQVPSLGKMPPGCRFQDRCERVQDLCRIQKPELLPHGSTVARCHFPVGLGANNG